MTETSQPSGPSADDQPFVPTGSPKPVRAGSVSIPDDRWYNLKFNYYDTDGKIQSGYAYYVGRDATWQYWDYISATQSNGPVARFRKVPIEGKGNRVHLKTDDGYFLSCRAWPRYWLYRSSAYPIGWEIVEGKLYTDYHDGAVGAEYQGVIVPEAYYMRVGSTPALFNCEWVLSPTQ